MRPLRIPAIALLLTCVPVLAGAAQGTPAAPPDEPARPGSPTAQVMAEDLGFIAGIWRGVMGTAEIEEQWMRPASGNLTGMFRVVEEGKAVFFELMTMDREADGPVLRLKHFDAGLKGWEEKDQAVTLALRSFRPGEAMFEGLDRTKPLRLTFRREGEDRLTVILDKESGGKRTSQAFNYTRAK